MAKDWDYWKSDFMYTFITGMNRTLDWTAGSTPIERIVGCELAKAQILYGYLFFKMTHQVKIDEYTLDFLVSYTSPTTNYEVIIECDGHDFHEKTREQASKDKKRDRHFTKKGYHILRYSGSDIVNNPEQVRRDLWELFYPKDSKEGVGIG